MSESTTDTTEATLAAALLDAATSPASASNDTGSVSTRPVADLIALDKYLAAKAATRSQGFGLIVGRVAFPGTV